MKDMALKFEAKEILLQLAQTIQELTIDEYTEKIRLLGYASIGEHTRHIIELFQQLLIGYEKGIINYDDRKRDIHLENDIDFACECIANIISTLCKENKELQLISLYNNGETAIKSNYERELMYNIEHCIHHQAMLKIGLVLLNKSTIDKNFGVAKSTIIYKAQCVQ